MNNDVNGAARDRGPGSGLAYRVLLRTDRWLLTGAILLAVFVTLVSLSRVGLTPLRTVVENHDGVAFLFVAFIGTIVTGTAIVVTINQLVLSQELGTLGDQHERMQGSMDVRRDVESAIGRGASPTDPAAFLSELAAAARERANALGEAIDDEIDADDAEIRRDVAEYVDDLTAETTVLIDGLSDAEFGTFEVIRHALAFDYSPRIHTGRRIRSEFGDTLPVEATDALDDTIEILLLFAPVREHLKTLYFQWELINLSRALLYVSVPALTGMGGLIMYVDAASLHGTVLGIDNLVWITSAGFVVGISPFAVFTAFVLRIMTVAKRTLAIGPFVLQ
ncbi:hypothetical protein [Halorubrum sp. DTA98]|uniref:hypothetical protein n=1 Tax=Halorubrum sp. DTA98 TaxID=3402163 RepID=UPI003AAF3C62